MCASRWSFTKNHYIMHGQQHIKFLHFVTVVAVGNLLVFKAVLFLLQFEPKYSMSLGYCKVHYYVT
jgi:hypothetical protein